ncbi:MAG TPA: precorrin-8X methylmutase [Desulfobacter sp.]|jgi:precorrin-8X/cobalt-precorrin-8 methylmutase|uniref:precorrin-8X methylmutase n=1 Tax=Desulfobacter sp. TaxID=2294 RepID=UPI000E8942BB|nr:precorrin-8X methylmutase [Desulfobacter sp.]MBP8830551.1 precorrin-8X methylmutase [Desulfobacter sp.]HAR34425.1 precorrin-8X methylmutase [Desulfobacter sp.]
MKPHEIEAKSFAIIDAEAGPHNFAPDEWKIVRRMIHTTADFEYMQMVRISNNAVAAGIKAIRNGCTVITDTNMAKTGIRKDLLAGFGSRCECLMADPRVAEQATERGVTRARVAVEKAAQIMENGIYVVGNAPTALLHLLDMINNKAANPALVVGLPVGFVNAAESKAALVETKIPYISNVGRKGGSNVAASVINALALIAKDKVAGERT